MKTLRFKIISSDIAAALIFIIFVAVAFYVSFSFAPPVLSGDPGAAFFPRLILAAMCVFSLVLLIKKLRFRASGKDESTSPEFSETVEIEPLPFLMALGTGLAMIIAMQVIGYELAAFGFLAFLLGWRTGRWLWALITAAISLVIIYFLFIILLKVHLPLLFLPQYLN